MVLLTDDRCRPLKFAYVLVSLKLWYHLFALLVVSDMYIVPFRIQRRGCSLLRAKMAYSCNYSSHMHNRMCSTKLCIHQVRLGQMRIHVLLGLMRIQVRLDCIRHCLHPLTSVASPHQSSRLFAGSRFFPHPLGTTLHVCRCNSLRLRCHSHCHFHCVFFCLLPLTVDCICNYHTHSLM